MHCCLVHRTLCCVFFLKSLMNDRCLIQSGQRLLGNNFYNDICSVAGHSRLCIYKACPLQHLASHSLGGATFVCWNPLKVSRRAPHVLDNAWLQSTKILKLWDAYEGMAADMRHWIMIAEMVVAFSKHGTVVHAWSRYILKEASFTYLHSWLLLVALVLLFAPPVKFRFFITLLPWGEGRFDVRRVADLQKMDSRHS